MILVAVTTCYLIGSIPTAGLIARLRRIDLRIQGSGNPGTNNALRTGGVMLAVSVLVVEAAKGYAAVLVANSMVDDWGAVVGGVAAVAGNVFNVWYGFSGGKGLGISLGVLLAIWPWVVLPLALLIALAALLTRSAGLAALTAIAGLLVAAFAWSTRGWSTGGLVESGAELAFLSSGMTAVTGWKHWRHSPLNPAWRSARRTPV